MAPRPNQCADRACTELGVGPIGISNIHHGRHTGTFAGVYVTLTIHRDRSFAGQDQEAGPVLTGSIGISARFSAVTTATVTSRTARSSTSMVSPKVWAGARAMEAKVSQRPLRPARRRP
ncbi:hypothetical protein [Pseudonocardia alaniniphila]|uniref:Uncharacterized protein n=1 Tax=Pseudonocardia alaniniphila TaxID=75291 RepID=A0ABS9TTK8_9PSEU|nr:hypothetical protein [Pseudonocardia alaniniphila]MCH6171880.1 hypothetical protein [Pseudonocardia alaniniphila]